MGEFGWAALLFGSTLMDRPFFLQVEEYLVQWKGHSPFDVLWLPQDDVSSSFRWTLCVLALAPVIDCISGN